MRAKLGDKEFDNVVDLQVAPRLAHGVKSICLSCGQEITIGSAIGLFQEGRLAGVLCHQCKQNLIEF